MPYDFYIKHNIHAVKWKLNAMIDKKKFYKQIERKMETYFI